jgi:hypothetical protein
MKQQKFKELERRNAVDHSVDPKLWQTCKGLSSSSEPKSDVHAQIGQRKQTTCHFVNNKGNHALYIL